MPGTHTDILDGILAWIHGEESEQNILWLCGSPGAGKTAIASSVVSELNKAGAPRASFFCKRDSTALCDPSAIFRSFAFDLAEFDPAIRESVLRVLKEDDVANVDVMASSIDWQFNHLLRKPSKVHPSRESSTARVVVVLDALDECGSEIGMSQERRVLLECLQQWSSLPPSWKLLVTSRSESDIERSLLGVSKKIELHTGDLVTKTSAQDLARFLKDRLSYMMADFETLPRPWPKDAEIAALVKHAAGLFQWADTAISFIGQDPVVHLNFVIRGDWNQAGDKLSQLYVKILERFNLSLEAFTAVMGTILFAKTPLNFNDLQHFLPENIHPSSAENVIKN